MTKSAFLCITLSLLRLGTSNIPALYVVALVKKMSKIAYPVLYVMNGSIKNALISLLTNSKHIVLQNMMMNPTGVNIVVLAIAPE